MSIIHKFVDKNCRTIFRRPLTYLITLILLCGIASYLYATLPTETSVESLIIEDDDDLLFYESFKEQFGEDEFLVVGISADDVFAPEILAFINDQTEILESFENVRQVVSLTNIDDFIGSDYDFIVERLIADTSSASTDRENIRRRAQLNSLIRKSVLNKDSTATLFFIRPENNRSGPGNDEQLVSRIDDIFSKAPPPWPGYKYHLAGWLVTDVNMSRAMSRDMMTFLPLTYLLLILLVSIALRNRWAVIISIINVTLCLLCTLALLNLIGGAFSPITSILPPLMMALAVSDSVHIFVEFFKQDRRQAVLTKSILDATRKLAMPCFLTSFTTAIGFLSLAISSVPPIRNFGLAAAGGMMIEFLLSVTVIPLGIHFLRNNNNLRQQSITETSIFHNILKRFACSLPKYRLQLLWGCSLLLVAALFFSFHIKVETNLLEYFKKSSPIRQASNFIDNELNGVETLEISLSAKSEGVVLEPETLKMIEKIEIFLEQMKIVSEVTSINDYLREMNKAFHNENQEWFKLPESRELSAQYLLLYDGEELQYLLDEERSWTRISARITEHNSSEIELHIKELQNYLNILTMDTPLEARVTGKALIANKLIDFIVNSQVQSLALALLLILLLLLKLFNSIKLGTLSLLPNIVPILLNFSFMGMFNIPLNSATAIIAAVAIGIAVDDTIHFIYQYQAKRKSGHSTEKAVQSAIVVKGTPIIMTTLIMTGGFGILLFGSFVPTIQFGILCSISMLSAAVADLLLLPAMLLTFDTY